MAFGDEREVVQVRHNFAEGMSVITATFAVATPEPNDLNIANHFTGAPVSNVDTLGFVEDQVLTNGVENDQGAIYSQVADGAANNTVTCSSNVADEQMLIFVLVGGPFESAPRDLADATGRSVADPTTTGISGSDTEQAVEYVNAMLAVRDPADLLDPWDRLGTAIPLSALTEYSGGGIATTSKRLDAAAQVLSDIGTLGVSRANAAGEPSMLGYSSYKEAALPPLEPHPEYGQRRAAIGDPSVYGATIVRS